MVLARRIAVNLIRTGIAQAWNETHLLK